MMSCCLILRPQTDARSWEEVGKDDEQVGRCGRTLNHGIIVNISRCEQLAGVERG